MTAGIAGEELDGILATHLLDPGLLRSADFNAFFADRRRRLLDLIGQAMGRPVLDADGDAPSAFVDEPEEEEDVIGEVEIPREGPSVDTADVRQAAEVRGPAATTNQTDSAVMHPDRAALERAFHAAMVDVYRRARQEAGYQAGYFLQMVSEHGGLETARRLLRAPNPSEGFTALWERRRLDLTVEAVVLKPEFAPLFTDEDRDIARTRLREYGYSEGE
jgi:hypothetical protein